MIGVFDSGLGGLSVLAAIEQRLPQADLCYLADFACAPYGDKGDDFIRDRALAISRYFVARGCSLIVVACNTATAAAISMLREALPTITVIGVEPGVKPAAASSRSGRIAVLSTELTARSVRLASLVQRYAQDVVVDILPCPGWADQVDTLCLDTPEFMAAIRKVLVPVLDAGADRIVIGCTHYSFLEPQISHIIAGRAELVDVASAIAEQCVRLAGDAAQGSARLELLATARPERLQAALAAFGLTPLLQRQTEPPRQVDI